MKMYVYKIQWLFPVRFIFGSTEKELLKELTTTIKILGIKSLDVINFYDKDMKKIDSYSSFNFYCKTEGHKKTIHYIKKVLKENENLKFVELLKK